MMWLHAPVHAGSIRSCVRLAFGHSVLVSRSIGLLRRAAILLVVGILLSIATGLLGVVCLFWGVLVGLLGQGPIGAVHDLSTRFLLGGLPLVLGVIYLTPVMAFRRRSWVLAYGVTTLLAALVLFTVAMNVALDSRNAWPALLCLLAPATALIAFVRLGRRERMSPAK